MERQKKTYLRVHVCLFVGIYRYNAYSLDDSSADDTPAGLAMDAIFVVGWTPTTVKLESISRLCTLMLAPISLPVKSMTIESGILSSGTERRNSRIIMLTIPPRFTPGERRALINFNGTETVAYLSTRKKSMCSGVLPTGANSALCTKALPIVPKSKTRLRMPGVSISLRNFFASMLILTASFFSPYKHAGIWPDVRIWRNSPLVWFLGRA